MPLHQFADVAISPRGDRVAAVESDDEPNSTQRPAERVVIRDARTGAKLATLPSCQGCTYAGLAFASDGALLTVVKDKDSTRLVLSMGRTAHELATFKGIAQ